MECAWKEIYSFDKILEMLKILRTILTHPCLKPFRTFVATLLSKSNIVLCANLHTGQKLQVDLASTVGRSIYLRGSYEPDVENILSRTLKEGDIFLDVGANVGYFSIVSSKLVGESGCVYSFEPSPRICRLLTISSKKNRLNNITIVPFALSNISSTVLFKDLHSSGFSYIASGYSAGIFRIFNLRFR